jgi:hypothetical protein
LHPQQPKERIARDDEEAYRVQAKSFASNRFFPSVKMDLRHTFATFLITSAWVRRVNDVSDGTETDARFHR